jgi:hypothetical protein
MMIDTERLLEKLRAERKGLDTAIRIIEENSDEPHQARAKGKRHLTAETRAKLSAAAKKRWSSKK